MRQMAIRALAVGFLLWTSPVGASFAATPTIEDRGGLFSPSAVDEGNRIIDEIHRETKPRKDVVVVTVSELPSDATSPQQYAERLFRERSVNGLLLFAVKSPGRLEVVVGRRTQDRFGASDRDELVRVMLDRFKKKQFDEGLVEGTRLAKTKLVAAFPAAERRPVGETGASATGLPAWVWVIVITAGVWLVLTLLSRAGQQSPNAPSPMSATGYPPATSGYGGFGRSLLGGLFGAMAGGWLYDRLSGRDEPMAYDRRDDELGDRTLNDEGDVGSTGGDDWGDSGGGDFGGGDDSGGGDF